MLLGINNISIANYLSDMRFTVLSRLPVFLNDSVIVGWMRQNVLIVTALTVLLTASLCFLIIRLRNRLSHSRKENEMSAIITQFVDERNKSEIILADLDVGVLGYSSDGILINSNPAALKMLGPEKLPQELSEFINRYGLDNGIQAALLLGNDSPTGKLVHYDRILRIRLKESRFDESRKAGTMIVIQDITDQEREERRRKEFVANVSHELKTPLTTIKTYSESLLDWGLDEKSPDSVRKDIWRIHDDSVRMSRLVEDLLLLSSIDSRGIRTKLEQLSFADLIRQNVDRMQLQAQEKDIQLSCLSVSQVPLVYADRSALERVITNLISNAIKYTEKNGEVKVFVGMLVDDVYVKVIDTGFGIEPEHLPNIFKRFYRVDMTGSRMYGGTGLGLSIAKELVELHHGKIQVSSILGKGTEFTVMIPSARKIFSDALESVYAGGGVQDSLYQKAAQEITAVAREHGMIDSTLDELDEKRSQELLSYIFETEESDISLSVDSAREQIIQNSVG
jgi:two-component system sensor histidine kinase VicK